MIVHSLQTEGTRVTPGLGLKGTGAGQSLKLIFPSIISISILFSLPEILYKIATGSKEFNICTINGQGFRRLK